jgi:hypothetical protein
MSKKVADIIVETLASAGVKHCYGVVGDTLNLIAGALSRSNIEWGCLLPVPDFRRDRPILHRLAGRDFVKGLGRAASFVQARGPRG